jgi:D-proline reductase (dithiol) PrdB
VSLVARVLEAGGIPTVVLGSALDIVEHCGVPRHLFTDLPLGNPCGVPYDTVMQRGIVKTALALFEEAIAPRTTVRAPDAWPDDDWKAGYMEVREEDLGMLRQKGAERREMLARQRARPQSGALSGPPPDPRGRV